MNRYCWAALEFRRSQKTSRRHVRAQVVNSFRLSSCFGGKCGRWQGPVVERYLTAAHGHVLVIKRLWRSFGCRKCRNAWKTFTNNSCCRFFLFSFFFFLFPFPFSLFPFADLCLFDLPIEVVGCCFVELNEMVSSVVTKATEINQFAKLSYLRLLLLGRSVFMLSCLVESAVLEHWWMGLGTGKGTEQFGKNPQHKISTLSKRDLS